LEDNICGGAHSNTKALGVAGQITFYLCVMAYYLILYQMRGMLQLEEALRLKPQVVLCSIELLAEKEVMAFIYSYCIVNRK
jgi:hypothetical protein